MTTHAYSCVHRRDETTAEDRQAITIAHANMMIAVAGAKRPRHVPVQAYPHMVELEYGRRLVGLVDRLRPIYKPVIADIGHLLAQLPRNDDERSDADPFARAILDQVRAKAKGEITASEARKLAEFFGDRVSQQQKEQLAKQLKAALGIEFPVTDATSGAREIVQEFADSNAAMIESIPENLHQDFANLAVRAYVKRMTPDTFAGLIEDKFGVAEDKARFLALDQIGSLHGQVNAARQQDLGVTHYFWITMEDEDVRPAHRKRQGKRFAFDDPPEGGLPGEDYGCRCRAQPDLNKIVAGVVRAQR